MPANLTPEYLSAEQEYKGARTHQEKIAALERMLATVPKHKGTEKLQADIKRRLSQERREAYRKGAAHSVPFYLVEKEGAAQVALAGPPNSGKSQLVTTLTHARPEVADYPFTTRAPVPGMMPFEDVQIQLVDLPPFSREFTEPWLPQVIRGATASVLVVDLGDADVLEEISFIEELFEERRLARPKMLAANKLDLEGAAEVLAALEELYGRRYRVLGISAAEGLNLERFRREVFDMLELVRVYTKPPGKKAELTLPYVLRRGQTVIDAARLVHKDFAENLKFARLYRAGHASGPQGMMVERSHVLEDGDILELHI
jgi:ribosome-interacting GTPase 1